MVVETERDNGVQYECGECGMLLETSGEAEGHEQRCEAEKPSCVQ
jgi:hypothetical protein